MEAGVKRGPILIAFELTYYTFCHNDPIYLYMELMKKLDLNILE